MQTLQIPSVQDVASTAEETLIKYNIVFFNKTLVCFRVLRASTTGVHISDEADQWFSEFLGLEGYQLYCFPSDGVPRYTKDRGKAYASYSTDQDMVVIISFSISSVFMRMTM